VIKLLDLVLAAKRSFVKDRQRDRNLGWKRAERACEMATGKEVGWEIGGRFFAQQGPFYFGRGAQVEGRRGCV